MENSTTYVAGTHTVDVAFDKRNENAGPVLNGQAGPGNTVPDIADSDAIAEEIQRKKRELSPLRYCRFIAENPKLAFGLTLGGQILMVAVTAILAGSGYDIIPITFDRIPLDIRTSDDYLHYVSWTNRFEDGTVIRRGVASDGTQVTRTQRGDVLELFFERDDGNVFTKANLQKMKEIEDEFWNNTEFQSSFCMRDEIPPYDCKKPVSVLRFFDGTYKKIDPILYDPTFDNIPRVLTAAKMNNDTLKDLYYALGKNSTITATHVYANILREKIYLGMPLIGYKNDSDRVRDQINDIQKFTVANFKPLGKKYFSEGVGDMDFFYSSMTLLFDAIMSYVLRDMSLVIGSICFIMLFLLFQTGSFWVSGWAVFSIMTGFCGANLIYRIALDYRYFGIFHVLAIFILLCIGADDIFIFYDTWKYSSHYQYKSLAHRLSDCYRKAAGAMLYTSVTTAVAFAVSATSPLLGISTFGLFSALLIVVNYISVIIFFPTVIVSYHIYWENYRCCCCCPRDASSVADVNDPTPQAAAKTKDGKRHNPVVRFFSGPYFRLITHPVARWLILTFFALLVSGAIYFVSRLEINQEQIKFLKDSTNFGRYMTKSGSAFPPRDDMSTTYIMLVWGLKNQDLSSCHRTDHQCMGDTVWDDSFHLNSAIAQQALLDLCRKLKTMSKEDRERLHIREDLQSGQAEVECFLDEMNSFYRSERDRKLKGARVYPNDTSLTLPVGELEGQIVMNNNPLVYENRSKLPEDFSRYFEVMTSFWLYNAVQPPFPSQQLSDYSSLVGEAKTPDGQVVPLPSRGQNNAWIYQYGTKLRFAAIRISTDLEESNLGYSKGLPIRDEWEDFLKNEKKTMPDTLQGGFQLTFQPGQDNNLWHWLALQKTLVRSAVTGLVVGLGVALPILIFATANIFTGLLATCSIFLSTLCVIAIIPLGGWKLGLMESINLTLVVGLSVDYVVHLAEGYSRSSHSKRLGRLHDTLAQVGISVLSGACTTIGGSAFLLIAEIILFMQFGVFMFATILFSIVFALGFFSTLLGIMGPEDDRGSIKPFKRWLWKVVTCKICKR